MTDAVPRQAHGDPVIGMADVSVSLGGRAIIESLSLKVDAGEFVCLVGPSGSGKTTILRLVAGLILPASGQVTYRQSPVTAPSSDIAFVFQDYTKALLPWRTAAQNVALALEARKYPRHARAQFIEQLLHKVGLADHATKYPAEMSGGMQQRLQIARCLAQEPSVMLMDEPFGALDPVTRDALGGEYRKLHDRLGLTTVMVTHDVAEAILLADRIVVMQSGAILADGAPAELLNHADASVRSLLETPRRQAERLRERLEPSHG